MRFSTLIKVSDINFDSLSQILSEEGFCLFLDNENSNIKIKDLGENFEYAVLFIREDGVLLKMKFNLFACWDIGYSTLLVCIFILLYNTYVTHSKFENIGEITGIVLAALIFRGIIMLPITQYLFVRNMTRLIGMSTSQTKKK